MLTIPDHLLYLHAINEKRNAKRSQGYYDRVYYEIEDLFIRPLFCRSDKMIALAKTFAEAPNARAVKLRLRKLFDQKAHQHGLIYGGSNAYHDLKLKYTNAQKETCSYYHHQKNTIFMHERKITRAPGNVKHALTLIYSFMHELAHALDARKFFSSGHDYSFHYWVMYLLKDFTGIHASKVYKQTHRVEHHHPNKPDVIYNFASHCLLEGAFSRAINKRAIRVDKHFDSISQAVAILNSRYGIDIQLKTSKVGKREAHETETVWREVVDFDHYNHYEQSFHVPDDDGIHDKYHIFVHRTPIGVKVYTLKPKVIFEQMTRDYIAYLERVHQWRIEHNLKAA